MQSASDSQAARQSREALRGINPGLRLLFRLVATLPLHAAQSIGASLAVVALPLVRREHKRLLENLRAAGFGTPAQARAATAEAGKTLIEMVWSWQKPQDELVKLVRRIDGEHWVEEARDREKGIIFLTPHLGCFEIAAHFAASYSPITVIYRPPRHKVFQAFAHAGRSRGNLRLVAVNTKGATALLGALRRAEWVGILPDQVPTNGEGEWAEFFGRPAYTMTLWHRLHERTGAAVILCFCERLARGKGYHIRLEPLPERVPGESPARQLNRALENLIRRRPEQYLWSYHRHRIPYGVVPPPGSDSAP